MFPTFYILWLFLLSKSTNIQTHTEKYTNSAQNVQFLDFCKVWSKYSKNWLLFKIDCCFFLISYSFPKSILHTITLFVCLSVMLQKSKDMYIFFSLIFYDRWTHNSITHIVFLSLHDFCGLRYLWMFISLLLSFIKRMLELKGRKLAIIKNGIRWYRAVYTHSC